MRLAPNEDTPLAGVTASEKPAYTRQKTQRRSIPFALRRVPSKLLPRQTGKTPGEAEASAFGSDAGSAEVLRQRSRHWILTMLKSTRVRNPLNSHGKPLLFPASNLQERRGVYVFMSGNEIVLRCEMPQTRSRNDRRLHRHPVRRPGKVKPCVHDGPSSVSACTLFHVLYARP